MESEKRRPGRRRSLQPPLSVAAFRRESTHAAPREQSPIPGIALSGSLYDPHGKTFALTEVRPDRRPPTRETRSESDASITTVPAFALPERIEGRQRPRRDPSLDRK